ncbi:hypothetical protein PL79_004595 [Burkholderia sp. USMB20]|nr:hypothetical protein PL79_004595 [Burkholderia sp. USMB20]
MRDAVPTGLMPGEQIDHAGHRCGNPNFYVNTHPCLFPKRNVTPRCSHIPAPHARLSTIVMHEQHPSTSKAGK